MKCFSNSWASPAEYGRGLVIQHGDLRGLLIFRRKLRPDVALEAVDEAHTKILSPTLVTRSLVDDGLIIGTPPLLADRRSREREPAGDLADDGDDLVAGNKPRHDRAGFLGVAFVVVFFQDDLATINSPGGR